MLKWVLELSEGNISKHTSVDNVIRNIEVGWFSLRRQLRKAVFAYLEMFLSFEPEIYRGADKSLARSD